VFSGAERMLQLIDRLSCTVTLRNGDIPMPETRITENPEHALRAVHEFGAAILKPLYSTKARGMCVVDIADGEAAARTAIEGFRTSNPVMYVQRRIELPGQDLGLVFLGGDYLGCYARVAADAAWDTTIHSGGRYIGYQPDAGLIEMATRAQALFGMDFTTVDVAETSEGPVVFEVSAFGGFRGAKEGIGLDVAARYTDYVLEQLT
jgi:ribosomal protein S6--L-glutamate ligase